MLQANGWSPCRLCPYPQPAFTRKRDYVNHQSRAHSRANYCCSFCAQNFTRQKEFMEVHLKETPEQFSRLIHCAAERKRLQYEAAASNSLVLALAEVSAPVVQKMPVVVTTDNALPSFQSLFPRIVQSFPQQLPTSSSSRAATTDIQTGTRRRNSWSEDENENEHESKKSKT
ncbi:unnamed protein product [Didymodactylos carnosus]|uniref:C2H2-type domain-containing protein n=1 Tax=Didymodactylos carnosus TaxID=1234261 RepID=A0A8S2USM4_9BILA|nr:unnamed protein product [Didymodactylos carnosus]CAF4359833.1 unnamed protein product [Didymodactylos carnosus]